MTDFKQAVKTCKNKLEYLNNRVSGVRVAIKGATNKAVLEALNTELRTLLEDISIAENDLRRAQSALDASKNEHRR